MIGPNQGSANWVNMDMMSNVSLGLGYKVSPSSWLVESY